MATQRALFSSFWTQFRLLALAVVVAVIAVTFFVLKWTWPALAAAAIFMGLVVGATVMSVARTPTPEEFPADVLERERASPPEM